MTEEQTLLRVHEQEFAPETATRLGGECLRVSVWAFLRCRDAFHSESSSFLSNCLELCGPPSGTRRSDVARQIPFFIRQPSNKLIAALRRCDCRGDKYQTYVRNSQESYPLFCLFRDDPKNFVAYPYYRHICVVFQRHISLVSRHICDIPNMLYRMSRSPVLHALCIYRYVVPRKFSTIGMAQ